MPRKKQDYSLKRDGVVLRVLMPVELLKKIERCAKHDGRSVASWVRARLEKQIGNELRQVGHTREAVAAEAGESGQ